MNILLFDLPERNRFFPLTLTRAMADLRMGILTIKERWEKLTNNEVYVLTEPYLQTLYDEIPAGEFLVVDPSIVAFPGVVKQVLNLQLNQGLIDSKGLIAGRLIFDEAPSFAFDFSSLIQVKERVEDVKRLEYPCNIFQWNETFFDIDFELACKGKISNNNDLETSNVIRASKVFIEEGAKVDYSILNASTGPIYIGKNAVVMEGCTIRGPFAMCEGAVLKMGSKVYGATTLGPECTGGGEIKNSVLMGYSNKAHDGYLGDSVIGEWCNLGAGTSNSNVKNTAGEVKVWNYFENDYISVGQKCGLVMGDYSRTSINTAINTGTVIGVCCNVFGEGLTPKVIPNFTWGTKELNRYEFEKALKDLDNWKKLKNKNLTKEDRMVLKHIFDNYND